VLGSVEQEIKKKIEKIGTPLKDWDIKINYGIKTGYNEAFIIEEQVRNELITKSPNCDEIIRPILGGRDIFKYLLKQKKWLITIPCGWTDNNRGNDEPEKYFKSIYPYIYEHFINSTKKQFKGKGLLQREDKGDYWWELRPCAYWQDFDSEKIVYSEIVREPQFCLDINKMFVNDTSFIMSGANIKYILALLNSKPVSFFFKTFYAGGGLGEEGYRYKKAFLEKLPLPTTSDIKIIEDLVDDIITLKKENKSTYDLENRIDIIVSHLYTLEDFELAHIIQF
jgi:hypothetical protein